MARRVWSLPVDALAMGSAPTRGEDVNLGGAAAMARGEPERAAARCGRARDIGAPEAATAQADLALLAERRPARR